ncbi:metallophosphoesterase [Pleomorphovibrio marinus]|uniref:metallophosphoesterase n=1 Tax=Pleomorphovibrio marinus TaxID=2164132 RepID=UPI000E0C9A2E|nr:metallophosphoesterase [Pleomorphovibrio marinus]
MRSSLRYIALAAFLVLVPLFLVAQDHDTYKPPALAHKDAWTLVLLPDTQTYVKFKRNQPILDLMANWVLENKEELNIPLVLHVGDLVEHNAWANPDGLAANQPGKAQWESVSTSMGAFDGKIPFIATTGNHDFGIKNAENRNTSYEEYFPLDKNHLTQVLLRDVSTGEDGMPLLTNATYEFVAPDKREFLILVLEFAPRDTHLDWAIDRVSDPKYENHIVILLTHTYLNRDSEHIESENYPLEDRNYGKAVFEKLVKPSKNIRMVFSGHIGAPDDPSAHVGFRSDINAAGKTVQQMTFNAQAIGGGWQGNGGDGWLRLLEFHGNQVRVKTFSPLFAISPSTQHLAWGTDVFAPFSFTLD